MPHLPCPLPEPDFWHLVATIDRPLLLSGREDLALHPLHKALCDLPAQQIIAFALRLAERLNMLLGAVLGRDVSYVDDSQLYAACFCIARGQAWFEASNRWPPIVKKDEAELHWCEPLLYVACHAWCQTTGQGEELFPVWTLEHGLTPFEKDFPLADDLTRAADLIATESRSWVLYAHFQHHPDIRQTIEPEEQIRVTVKEMLDHYFWRLLDLGDYLGLEDEAGNCFQMLHDAGKNLYWCEVPRESDRTSYGQEFSREALLQLIQQLPRHFSPEMFSAAQRQDWDE